MSRALEEEAGRPPSQPLPPLSPDRNFTGGAFGRLTLINTVTDQELLDCNHSQAHEGAGCGDQGGGGGCLEVKVCV